MNNIPSMSEGEHALIIHKTKDNGELISTAYWRFVVEPYVDVRGATDVFRDGKTVPVNVEPHELEEATMCVRQFLFKQRATPISTKRVWAIEPPLNEAEWLSIKKQLLVEEL